MLPVGELCPDLRLRRGLDNTGCLSKFSANERRIPFRNAELTKGMLLSVVSICNGLASRKLYIPLDLHNCPLTIDFIISAFLAGSVPALQEIVVLRPSSVVADTLMTYPETPSPDMTVSTSDEISRLQGEFIMDFSKATLIFLNNFTPGVSPWIRLLRMVLPEQTSPRNPTISPLCDVN